MPQIELDDTLLDALIRSTNAGLQMAGVTPKAVGCSRMPARTQEIAVVIGLVGRRNGTVTLHVSRRAALYLASRFTEAEIGELDEEAFDAVGEITNIVAGRLKAELGGEEYGITNISCPSIIVGGDYQVYQFRGFKTASVEFELDELPAIFFKDRLFCTTVSLSQS